MFIANSSLIYGQILNILLINDKKMNIFCLLIRMHLLIIDFIIIKCIIVIRLIILSIINI